MRFAPSTFAALTLASLSWWGCAEGGSGNEGFEEVGGAPGTGATVSASSASASNSGATSTSSGSGSSSVQASSSSSGTPCPDALNEPNDTESTAFDLGNIDD